MSTVGSGELIITANTRSAERQIHSFAASIQKDVYAITGSLSRAGNQLAVAITAPIVAAGTAAFKSAAQVEDLATAAAAISAVDFRNVEAIQRNAEEFARAAVQVGADLRFTSQDIAEAEVVLARAGVSSSAILEDNALLLRRVGELANVAAVDLATAANIAVTSVGSFGMEVDAENIQRFSDVLAIAANRAPTTINDLQTAVSYVGPVASELGLTVEDTAAALDVLAAAGIKGSRAGTGLQRVLLGLVNPTKQAEDRLNELGINVTDADGNFKDFGSVLTEFNRAMRGLAEGERAEIAGELFGQRGGPAFLKLIESANGSFEDFSEQLYNADGAAAALSATIEDTTLGNIDRVKGSLESLSGVFFNLVKDDLNVFLKTLDSGIDSIGQWSEESLKLAGSTIAFVAALGPAIRLTGFFADNFKPLLRLFASVGPVFALQVLAPLAAAGGVFTLAVRNSEKLQEALGGLLGTIRGFFTGETETFAPLGNALSKLATDLEPITTKIGDYLATIVNSFSDSLGSAESGVQTFIVEKIGQIPEALQATVDAAQSFAPVVQKVFDDLRAGVEGFIENIGQDGISDIFTVIEAGLRGAVIAVVSFADVFATLAPAVGAVAGPILDIIAGIVSLADAFGALGPVIDLIIFAMGVKFVRSFTAARNAGATSLKAIGLGFTSIFTNAEKTNESIKKTTGHMGNLGSRTAKIQGQISGLSSSFADFNKRIDENAKFLRSFPADYTHPLALKGGLPEQDTFTTRRYTEAQAQLLAFDHENAKIMGRIQSRLEVVKGIASAVGGALVAGFAFAAIFAGIDLVKGELSEAKDIARGIGETLDESLARINDEEFVISPENIFRGIDGQNLIADLTKEALVGGINEGNEAAFADLGIDIDTFADKFAQDRAEALRYATEQAFANGATFTGLAEVTTPDAFTGQDTTSLQFVKLQGEEAAKAFNDAVQNDIANGLNLTEALSRNISDVDFGREEGAGFLERAFGLDGSNIDDLFRGLAPEIEDSLKDSLRRVSIDGTDLQRRALREAGINEVNISGMEIEEIARRYADFANRYTGYVDEIEADKRRFDNIFNGNFAALDGVDAAAAETLALINEYGDAFDDGKIKADGFKRAMEAALGYDTSIDPTEAVRAVKDRVTRVTEEALSFGAQFDSSATLTPEFFDPNANVRAQANAGATQGQLAAYDFLENFKLTPQLLQEEIANAFAEVTTPEEAATVSSSIGGDVQTLINEALANEIISPETATLLQSQVQGLLDASEATFQIGFEVQTDPDIDRVLDIINNPDSTTQAKVDAVVAMTQEDRDKLFEFVQASTGLNEYQINTSIGIENVLEPRMEFLIANGTLDSDLNTTINTIFDNDRIRQMIESGVSQATIDLLVDAPRIPNTYFSSGYGSGPDGQNAPGGASGGLFTTATRRTIGEAGPELLLPLSRPNRAMALLESLGFNRGEQKPTTMVNSNTSYTINGVDPGQVAALIAAKQEAINLRIGASL